jgi:hypothetical protein
VLTGLSARLIVILEPDLIQCDDWDGVRKVVTGFLRTLSLPATLSNFLSTAFKIATPAGAEEQALIACQALPCARIGFARPPQQENARTLPVSVRRARPIIRRLTDGIVVSGTLLKPQLLNEVRRMLPPQMDRHRRAILRYRMSVDGTVLSTLISKSVEDGLWVLVCGTDHGVVGAAFTGSLTIGLARRGKFVEQGMVVVFAAEGDSIRVYKRVESGNTTLYSVEPTGIAFGGPRPAFYLGADLRKIVSARCETFASPSLVSDVNVGDFVLETELFQIVSN